VLSYLPFVDPLKIGGALDKSVYSAVMLIAIWNGGPDRVPMQLALYSVVGSLRSDFLFDFPLSARGTIAAAKYLTPAILLAQLSYPDATGSSAVRLAADGRLEIRRRDGDQVHLEASIVPLFRKLGYFGAIRLCRRLPPGNSFRYAGTLPMTAAPTTRYQTHTDGRLSGTRAIYIADGSTLSPLPSKNHTFTMMANAMRVADCVWRSLE